MKKGLFIPVVIIAAIAAFLFMTNNTEDEIQEDNQIKDIAMKNFIEIIPIEHASAVIKWGDTVIYTDPVGGAELYATQPKPDFILLTDIHGDHLDIPTLDNIVTDETVLVVPPAVAKELPAIPGKSFIPLASRVVVLVNGESAPQGDIMVTAVPMYNIPESEDAYHVKGRGNGYLLERDGKRVYISGDTADIPEMRQLKNIDVAFVSMNLPYTMDVDAAASAVLEFKPKQVIPYHYRGTEGFSDVNKFKELVNAGDPNIEVLLLEWYPE